MMFGPFESIVLGISGLVMGLAALRLGAWAMRASVRGSAGEGIGE